MKRFLWLGFVLSLYLICSGCGQTYRPIIIPNPPTFPNPAAAHTVVSINDNGAVVAGSAMVIDVSGDSDVSIANTNIHSVHAAQSSASQILVVNQAVTGLGVPTSTCLVTVGNQVFNVCPSLTLLNFSSTTIASTSSVSLPIYSSPNFVAVAPSASTAYVTLPTYPPNPNQPPPQTIVPSVGIVSLSSRSLTATVPVGNNPSALVVTPDQSKLYVANQGDSTVGGYDTVGNVTLTQRIGSPISTTSPPIWFAVRSDSQAVYVLEANGTLAALSITSTTGPDTLVEYPAISVPGATTMTYDPNLNRLYIPGGQQVAIVDVSQSAPNLLKTISVPPFTVFNIQQSVPATAAAVAALPDGSRAYVGSSAVLPSQLNISSVSGDGTTATFAYSLAAGHDLNPGISITVTGTNIPEVADFDGTYIVSAVVSGTTACPSTCFQAYTSTSTSGTSYPVSGSGSGTNIFPQVTVVWVASNTIKTTAAVPGVAAYDAFCGLPVSQGGPRFRISMAPGGDSSRAYLASCDGGMVDIIDTATDSYILNQQEPAGTRNTNPPSPQNFPQNPVLLLAGP